MAGKSLKDLIKLIFSRETLPLDPIAEPPRQRGLVPVVETLIRPEPLPQDPPSPGSAERMDEKRQGSILEVLLKPEPLPQDPPTVGEERKGLLKLLLEGEPLPQDPLFSEKKMGLLRTILEKETLPREPEQELR